MKDKKELTKPIFLWDRILSVYGIIWLIIWIIGILLPPILVLAWIVWIFFAGRLAYNVGSFLFYFWLLPLICPFIAIINLIRIMIAMIISFRKD